MKTRLEIINEVKRVRSECAQIITDAEHWNSTHPSEEPIDPDPDGELHRIIAGCDATLANEIRICEPN